MDIISPVLPPTRDARVQRAMRFVETHLAEPLGGPAIARAAGVSYYHFLRLFHEQVGETVGDYVRRIRLEAAAMRLAWTREPIAMIAADVGYGGQSSFTRAFTAHFGRSPARYRLQGEESDAVTPVQLSGIRVRRVDRLACIARRFTGSPAQIPAFWARFRAELPNELRHEAGFFLGIVHTTPARRGEPIDYACARLLSAGMTPGEYARGHADHYPLVTPPAFYASLCHRSGYDDGWFEDFGRISAARRAAHPNARAEPTIEVHRQIPTGEDDGSGEFEMAVPLHLIEDD